jgi:hypothetical protein
MREMLKTALSDNATGQIQTLSGFLYSNMRKLQLKLWAFRLSCHPSTDCTNKDIEKVYKTVNEGRQSTILNSQFKQWQEHCTYCIISEGDYS